MHRLLLILSILLAAASQAAASVWYSVNYDKKTVAAMTAAFGTETATEMYYSEQVRKILDRYSAAEVATAGIFMSKYLDRKALTDLGIWSSATENYYYRRIYSLVSIIAKTKCDLAMKRNAKKGTQTMCALFFNRKTKNERKTCYNIIYRCVSPP